MNQQLPKKLEILAISETEMMKTKEMISQAWKIIKQITPEAYKEAIILAPVIVVIKAKGLISFSEFNLLGNLHFADCSTKKYMVDYIEAIIHECAHTILFSFSAEDHIVLNDINQTYTSAIRKDPRPMIGIFHAFFVATRVILMFRKLINSNSHINIQEKERAKEILAQFTNVYQDSLQTIKEHGVLTEKAKTIMDECTNLVVNSDKSNI